MPHKRPLSIHPVRTKADFRQFFACTRHVYADDPQFVQPLFFERMDHISPTKNPALRQMEVAYWVVMRGLDPVGRISAQINQAHLDRHQDQTGHFGFFEAIDDPEVIQLLLSTAEIWARARGMSRLQGPFTLSINDESGLLIDGFSHGPNMMMPHGRPYYRPRLEALGYQKSMDLIAYEIPIDRDWPTKAQKLIQRAHQMKGLTLRALDMSRFEDEIRMVCDIFNDAWADNWNFIPFGEAEAVHMAKSMKPIVSAHNFAIAELNGEPVAMVVTLPNLNEAIRDLDGRLLPFGWAKLLWRLKVKGVKTGRMPLMGVRKSIQRSVKGAAVTMALIAKVHEVCRKTGVETGELSWILETNEPVKAVIETVGGRPYKTYRIFERSIQ